MRTAGKIYFAVLICLCLVLAGPAYSADNNDEPVRIGIMNFRNKANGLSNLQADGISDVFTRVLANSPSIAVIERDRLSAIAFEHRINLSGVVDSRMAVDVGKLAGCKYMLLGSVTKFNVRKKGQGISGWFAQKRTDVQITLDVRLVDVQTGEVVLSVAETGTASQSSSAISVGGATQTETSSGGIEDAAIQDAVNKIGRRVLEVTVGEYMQVLRAGGEEIAISLGAISGAYQGAYYRVNAEGDEVFDLKGNSVGRMSKTIAIVQITEVENEFSTARIVKNGGNPALIRRGDKLVPIAKKEAMQLIKKKKISRERPGVPVDDVRMANIDAEAAPAPVPQETAPVPEPPATVITASANSSTNPDDIVPSYGLPEGETRARISLHKRLQNSPTNSATYARYTEMINSFPRDYLAAYQAGMTARSLGRMDDAADWLDKALAINPSYVPAQEAKSALESAPAPKPTPAKKPAKTTRARKRKK